MSETQFDLTDTALMDRWERIIKIENLQADTALKQAQTRYVPWQVWSAGATAGGAVVAALIAVGHWL